MSRIWALTDDRAGHTAQTLGLADALGMPYARIMVHTNLFSSLPNGLLGASLLGIDSLDKAKLTAPWPDLVIATGRRLVPLMRYIKSQSPATMLVQCMWPGRLEPFDRIIVPEHDEVPNDARIMRTLGAIHGLQPTTLQAAESVFSTFAAELKRPIVGVLVGGKTKTGTLSDIEAARLIDLSELLASGGTPETGSIAITTSRRTPRKAVRVLNKRPTCPLAFYRYGSAGANPYHAILGGADALVVTGDSVSMLSEACSLGKPVFVFECAAQTPKHRAFCRSLYEQGYAQKLTGESSILAANTRALNEATHIAAIVKEDLKHRLKHSK